MALTKTGTDGIKDDAVTLDKLAHGTSGQDGKFLRANNGAAPSFETVSIPAGTTINNNASTKFITGTNNANELDCEANLSYNNSLVTFANSNFKINKSGNATIAALETGSNKEGQFRANTDGVLVRTLGSYPLILHTDQTERMRIDASGNVGINENAPSFELVVKANDSNESAIQILAGGNGKESNLLFGAPDDHDVGAIKYDHNGDHMKFIVGGSERIKVNSNGIQFGGSNGSQHGLDDYEEGTYTPTVTCTSSGTISLHGNGDRLSYTKVGRSVTVHGTLTVDSVSSPSGDVNISLPFTAANLDANAGRTAGSSFVWGAVNNPTDFVWALWVNESTSVLYIRRPNTNNSAHKVQANTEFFIGITYPTT